MKRFNAPKITVVQLTAEDVLATSLCTSKQCSPYDCPDCPTLCNGVYHCQILVCTNYET